jgi:hypothetical protein
MHFVFDGGHLDDGAGIRLQQAELDDYRFTAEHELPAYLPSFGLRRVTGALRARELGKTIFLPHDAG